MIKYILHISYHTSDHFYIEILKLFKNQIKKIYPNLENELGKKLKKLKTNIRFNKNLNDISLDCQISMNSPVTKKSTVSSDYYNDISCCSILFIF